MALRPTSNISRGKNMSILVGIDGTSADSFGFDDKTRNEAYDAVFANSFVKRICGRSGLNTMYLRGPGYLPAANGLVGAILKGQQFILSRRWAGVNEPVLLTGYSRGAAGVIVIAKSLRRPPYNIGVKAMLLFDCVNRDMQIDSDTIPDNVGDVLHVMRSDESGSRGSFGHSGTHPLPRTRYKEAIFTCTHGAMGGVPWPMEPGKTPNTLIVEGAGAFGVPEKFSPSDPLNWKGKPTNVTYAQDARGAERVWSYIKPFMREHGFPIPPDFYYSSQLGISGTWFPSLGGEEGIRKMYGR
jgi:hypothetical protein